MESVITNIDSRCDWLSLCLGRLSILDLVFFASDLCLGPQFSGLLDSVAYGLSFGEGGLSARSHLRHLHCPIVTLLILRAIFP